MLHMTGSAIASDILKTLDIQGRFCTKLTFHRIFVFENVTNLTLFFFSQIVALLRLIDAQLSADLTRGEKPDSVDSRQTVLDSLVFRQIDTSNTCHKIS